MKPSSHYSHFSLLVFYAISLLFTALYAQAEKKPLANSVTTPNKKNISQNMFFLHSPLSPTLWNTSFDEVFLAKWLIERQLQEDFFNNDLKYPIQYKLKKSLLHFNNAQTLESKTTATANTALLYLYGENHEKSHQHFLKLYRFHKTAFYYFYASLNLSIFDVQQSPRYWNTYLNLASGQKEGILWQSLAKMVLKALHKKTLPNKEDFISTIHWLYQQKAYYTCFLMLKFYETKIVKTKKDIHFITSLKANLLIRAGHPQDAISLLENVLENNASAFTESMRLKLSILYYKTKNYTKALEGFTLLGYMGENTAVKYVNPAGYYYAALTWLQKGDDDLFQHNLDSLKQLTGQSTATRKAKKYFDSLQYLANLEEIINSKQRLRHAEKKPASSPKNAYN